MTDLIGWFASALFIASYLLPPKFLRSFQVSGALVWAFYGVLLQAMPIIVANLLMIVAVGYSARREKGREGLGRPGASAA